jgi:PhzF family phenazine biosynthesis protein
MALVDAFTTDPLSGNAAGVIPDAEGLSDDQFQAIARELAVSETAFVLPSETADRKLRYFTPTQEVSLCGHATIGAHALLHESGVLDVGSHSLETAADIIEIEIAEDGTVWMSQETPTIEERSVDYTTLADALGVDEATLQDVGADLPVARSTTGLPVLIVPINFLASLSSATPDMNAVEQLSEEHEVAGIYVFTFDTLAADSTAHGRFFAPTVGVDEDPVTGTASAACGAYLDTVGAAAFDTLPEELRFEQGHLLDRGGLVRVRVEHDREDVDSDSHDVDSANGNRVRVGGRAVTAIEGTLTVPDHADDEIIEL